MIRIGHGYDVHRLVEGYKLFLGGVEIPFEKGLEGHSDADVLLHAICDALLGAAALGDIGYHFPPDEPEFKGISSIKLLERVTAFLSEKGYSVVNLDSTVVAQRPKLAPFIPKMRSCVADCIGIDKEFVSIKATTEEGLGFSGRGEGISATAVCLIEKK